MPASLEQVNASVKTNSAKGWRAALAFIGPAYMISVGYMDPGNWATDIAGGSALGYELLWVLLMSNLMALLMQSHCIRLGIVCRKDLAQASKAYYPKIINIALYILAELAIAACDMAEVIGMAIGLHLLFPSVSLLTGVLITVLDSFILLLLIRKGIRKLEAFIISLVALIGISFFIQLFLAKPALSEIAQGFIPGLSSTEALYLAIGIIGATVMPHNLYLHSSLVQTRSIPRNRLEIKRALRFNLIDSTIALNLAFFVNAAILIVSASAFFKNGFFEITQIEDAHHLLAPLLGSTLAPILFALSLIAAGQSSTITGTLAGQVVMEGYLNLRLSPWARRLITRLIAIVPATLVILLMGEAALGKLLVFSQVILSLQLGFAIIPLIYIVSDRNTMGEFAIPLWQKILSWCGAIIIIGLNLKLVFSEIQQLIYKNNQGMWWGLTLIPILLICLLLLAFIVVLPLLKSRNNISHNSIHNPGKLILQSSQKPQRIGICLDFSSADSNALKQATALVDAQGTLILFHVLESAGALIYGEDTFDAERENDYAVLQSYQDQLCNAGYTVMIELGFGSPAQVIPKLCSKNKCDLLIMGTHGHRTFKDWMFGTTVEKVRHDINIPLLLV